jgi:hypothetical protein
MFNTKLTYPWWRTTLDDVSECLSGVKLGNTDVLCRSAGGREIGYVTYGEKPDFAGTANYNSACGALNTRFYADKSGRPPVVMLVGAVHAQELEGTAALINLISMLETGKDLRGHDGSLAIQNKPLRDLVFENKIRLIIIPILNVDGRVRCQPDSMLGMTNDELRYWGQGTWKDGSLCGWPECKSVHPIKNAAGFLGAYYNDDGINLMHDDFFNPMAKETSALLRLAANEAPDYIILLHGGSNSTNELLQSSYVPLFIKKKLLKLAERIAEYAKSEDMPSHIRQPKQEDFPPPSFNLASALHHVCGGVSATYESNQGLAEKNCFTAEDILKQHYLLFRGVFEFSVESRVSDAEL